MELRESELQFNDVISQIGLEGPKRCQDVSPETPGIIIRFFKG
jgi:hypothetical protein